eukprot:GHRQ01036878.1.p1 GENE.GHRQ01036878.1~~GHRQ01036878.1.p1  ORF type:complete len:221 (-),score=7.12 GHRQ01036878.1:204-866(-)
MQRAWLVVRSPCSLYTVSLNFNTCSACSVHVNPLMESLPGLLLKSCRGGRCALHGSWKCRSAHVLHSTLHRSGATLVKGLLDAVLMMFVCAIVFSAGAPPMYKDVLFYVAGDSDQTEYLIKFSRASRAGLQKALDNQGCDAVQDPDTGELVTFDSIELRDNILLVASRGSAPWKARVRNAAGGVQAAWLHFCWWQLLWGARMVCGCSLGFKQVAGSGQKN